jgi:hypothetical protein
MDLAHAGAAETTTFGFAHRGPHSVGQGAERCSLDVSLHDEDLADEVDLMVRLIVAVNEADHALAQGDIDEILGVPAHGLGSRRFLTRVA